MSRIPGGGCNRVRAEALRRRLLSPRWGPSSDVGAFLDQAGVAVRTGHHCCQPLMGRYGVSGTVRASLGLCTELADTDALMIALTKAKRYCSKYTSK